MPSFERNLIQTVGESLAEEPISDWPDQSIKLCLSLLVNLRNNAEHSRQAIEEVLIEGIEGRSLVRDFAPLLATTEERIALLQKLTLTLSAVQDTPGKETLISEARLLENENLAIRGLLQKAFSIASEAPRPVDWDRVREVEEAHASGKTKRFSQR
jgi:hypothetical protein